MGLILLSLLALVCGMSFDFLWVWCVAAVEKKKPFQAANLSLILYVVGIVSTILIIEECCPAVIAYGIGCWIGTYFGVRRR